MGRVRRAAARCVCGARVHRSVSATVLVPTGDFLSLLYLCSSLLLPSLLVFL